MLILFIPGAAFASAREPTPDEIAAAEARLDEAVADNDVGAVQKVRASPFHGPHRQPSTRRRSPAAAIAGAKLRPRPTSSAAALLAEIVRPALVLRAGERVRRTDSLSPLRANGDERGARAATPTPPGASREGGVGRYCCPIFLLFASKASSRGPVSSARSRRRGGAPRSAPPPEIIIYRDYRDCTPINRDLAAAPQPGCANISVI